MTNETPSWVRNAKVGDKIVCFKSGKYGHHPLVMGNVYEISGFYDGGSFVKETGKKVNALSLMIRGLEHWDGAPPFCTFMPGFFRPLTKAKDTSKEVSKLIRMASEIKGIDA